MVIILIVSQYAMHNQQANMIAQNVYNLHLFRGKKIIVCSVLAIGTTANLLYLLKWPQINLALKSNKL